MKKILILWMMVVGSVMPAMSQALEVVTQFVVLETLIENHKTLSNQLRKRSIVDAAVAVETIGVENRTTEYEHIVDTLQKRVEGVFSGVQFGLEITNLSMLAVKTADLSTDAVSLAADVGTRYPLAWLYGAQALTESGRVISDIYKLVAMVAGGGSGVVLATNEDRTQFCFMIRSKILHLQNVMAALSRNCRAMEYGFYQPSPQTTVSQEHIIRAFEETVLDIERLKAGI